MSLCPLPLSCTDTYGTLAVGATSLTGPAWCAYDLSVLADSLDFQGENVVVPWLAGSDPRGLLGAETAMDLPMMLSGATDQAGTAHVNPAGGLIANREALIAAVITPIRDGTAASFTAVWTRPDPDDPAGTVDWQADVQPRMLSGWEFLPLGYASATLEVVQIGPWTAVTP